MLAAVPADLLKVHSVKKSGPAHAGAAPYRVRTFSSMRISGGLEAFDTFRLEFLRRIDIEFAAGAYKVNNRGNRFRLCR
jgi:hypothetical protein